MGEIALLILKSLGGILAAGAAGTVAWLLWCATSTRIYITRQQRRIHPRRPDRVDRMITQSLDDARTHQWLRDGRRP